MHSSKQRWERLYRCDHWGRPNLKKAAWLDDCYRIYLDFVSREKSDQPISKPDVDESIKRSDQERLELSQKYLKLMSGRDHTPCSCCGVLAGIRHIFGGLCRTCAGESEEGKISIHDVE